jgi:hypothetical protein
MFDVGYVSDLLLDLIKKELKHGSAGFALVVDDPDLHLEFVLKLIMSLLSLISFFLSRNFFISPLSSLLFNFPSSS